MNIIMLCVIVTLVNSNWMLCWQYYDLYTTTVLAQHVVRLLLTKQGHNQRKQKHLFKSSCSSYAYVILCIFLCTQRKDAVLLHMLYCFFLDCLTCICFWILDHYNLGQFFCFFVFKPFGHYSLFPSLKHQITYSHLLDLLYLLYMYLSWLWNCEIN